MSTQHDALCLDALYADVILRTLLHDIRGHLATVSGWAELATLDGHSIPDGMMRGVDSLRTLADSSGDYVHAPLTESTVLTDLLDALPGAVAAPPAIVVRACPLRLRAVLRAARPEQIQVAIETDESVAIELSGLPTEGVELANRPLLSRLKELRDLDHFDPRLCTALLPAATSACSGRFRAIDKTSLAIQLRKDK